MLLCSFYNILHVHILYCNFGRADISSYLDLDLPMLYICVAMLLMYAFSDMYYDNTRPSYVDGRRQSYAERRRSSGFAATFEGLNTLRFTQTTNKQNCLTP